MAVQMNLKTKSKEKTPLKTKPAAKTKTIARLEELVDEIGDLKVTVEKLSKNPKLVAASKRLGELSDEFNTLIDEAFEADAEGRVRGAKWEDTFGKKGLKRTIKDIEKVFECMGEETFTANATVPLKAVDDYLTPEEREECIDEERVNARRHKFEKAVS